jgi:hypothetical protein
MRFWRARLVPGLPGLAAAMAVDGSGHAQVADTCSDRMQALYPQAPRRPLCTRPEQSSSGSPAAYACSL